MSEMLGNQYFMARKFAEAEKVLQKCALEDPTNTKVKKKLIICYVDTGKLNNAVDLFISLIKENIDIILDTHPIHDDCPCPELIYDYEKKLDYDRLTDDDLVVLGILWLYCDFHKSLEKFEEAMKINEDNLNIKTILTIMKLKEVELKQKDKNPYIS